MSSVNPSAIVDPAASHVFWASRIAQRLSARPEQGELLLALKHELAEAFRLLHNAGAPSVPSSWTRALDDATRQVQGLMADGVARTDAEIAAALESPVVATLARCALMETGELLLYTEAHGKYPARYAAQQTLAQGQPDLFEAPH